MNFTQSPYSRGTTNAFLPIYRTVVDGKSRAHIQHGALCSTPLSKTARISRMIESYPLPFGERVGRKRYGKNKIVQSFELLAQREQHVISQRLLEKATSAT